MLARGREARSAGARWARWGRWTRGAHWADGRRHVIRRKSTGGTGASVYSKEVLPRPSFDPKACEMGRYARWEEAGAFRPNDAKRAQHEDRTPSPTYSMLLPPPNVTGVLHVGHALTVALQDALARWRRMKGDRVLWIPGLDHAGIATQSVVERRLLAKSPPVTRHDLGREKFLSEVWDWREAHGDRIIDQLKGMGASLDWESQYFTLDAPRSDAVVEAFVRLHEAGLLYRRRRHVNWSCALRTAISDIEVDHVALEKKNSSGGEKFTLIGPIPGHDPKKKYKFGAMVRFAYVVDSDVNDEREELVVATTRLETMMGDVAVAVHPDDARYMHLHGRSLIHPFRPDGHPLRKIPIVTDAELVDPSTGTGAVKITPAHDPADYECAVRVMERSNGEHDFPLNLQVFGEDGKITGDCKGVVSEGTPRYDARELLEHLLSVEGLLREEDEAEPEDSEAGLHDQSRELEDSGGDGVVLPTCSRSGDIVEPLLLPQWYVDTSALSQSAGRMGDEIIRGERHAKEWQRWLGQDQSQDWCVSRQLWWGHRIPAWRITNLTVGGEDASHLLTSYLSVDSEGADESNWIVARNENDANQTARARVLEWLPHDLLRDGDFEVVLVQDEDVLDTWFSSAILPLSALGWPAKMGSGADSGASNLLEAFYPLSVMETGSDILFFWVARMAMLCSFLENESPRQSSDTCFQTGGRAPFEQVLLHPMVRDKRGRKMSKSLGNVVDPLDVVNGVDLDSMLEKLQDNANMGVAEKERSAKDLKKEYPKGIPECGVDGLRFALCSYLEGPNMSGTINLDIQRAVSARHMCNKLWNASRFVLSHVLDVQDGAAAWNDIAVDPDLVKGSQNRLASAWILSRLDKTATLVSESMEGFELASATSALREFLINDFCDVYLELVKEPLQENRKSEGGDVNEDRVFLCRVMWTCLSSYLKILHPIMPFVTEEIRESSLKVVGREAEGNLLVNSSFPTGTSYECEQTEIDFTCGVLNPAKAVRSLRKLASDTFGKEAMEGAHVEILGTCSEPAGRLVSMNIDGLRQLSRCRDVTFRDTEEREQVRGVRGACLSRQLVLPQDRGSLTIRVTMPPTFLAESAEKNAQAEIKRLLKRLNKSAKQLEKLQLLTSKPKYLTLSPAEVQARNTQKMDELTAQIGDIQTTIAILESVGKT